MPLPQAPKAPGIRPRKQRLSRANGFGKVPILLRIPASTESETLEKSENQRAQNKSEVGKYPSAMDMGRTGGC